MKEEVQWIEHLHPATTAPRWLLSIAQLVREMSRNRIDWMFLLFHLMAFDRLVIKVRKEAVEGFERLYLATTASHGEASHPVWKSRDP